MKIFFLCFLLSTFALDGQAKNTLDEKRAKIFCPRPVYHFGTVDNQRIIRHEFELINKGNEPLIIADISPACGCTTANIEKSIIKPGQKTKLYAELSLHGRTGEINKPIMITSNDPNQTYYQLTFEGIGVEELTITPKRLFFGPVRFESPVTRKISITAPEDPHLRIKKVESDSEFFTAKLDPSSSKKQTVLVTAPAKDVKGVTKANIHIKTNSKRYPVIDIPASSHVVTEDLTALPEAIRLFEDIKDPVKRTIVLLRGKNINYKIKKVIPPDPKINVEIESMANGNYRIRLDNIMPSAKLKSHDLKIFTDFPEHELKKIPFEIIKKNEV